MSTYLNRTHHDAAAVLAAVQGWIGKQDGRPFYQDTVKRAVARSLDGDQRDPWDRATEQQVARVLNKLAAGGTLVKVERGGTGPDGCRNRTRQPLYYTPDAYAAAQAKAAEDAGKAAATAVRWIRVHDELERQGISPASERGMFVRLSTASWFRLLGLDGDLEGPAR